MQQTLLTHPVAEDQAGQTLAAVVRLMRPGESWTKVRGYITARRVLIGQALCMDPARRMKTGEVVTLTVHPAPVPKGERPADLVIRHLDEDVVVVEKTSGVSTMRHPAERDWDEERRELVPTLDDVTQHAIAKKIGTKKHDLPRLRIVHRLDKDTSGLVVFARSVQAERSLGAQFKAHEVLRRYIAVVNGFLSPQTFSTWLARDRGDGRRGSGPEGTGKHAVTHVDVLDQLPQHTIMLCQLETGRTHQIRIHLAEAGHPVCGETVYTRKANGDTIADPSNAPRLALHAVELGFVHPTTNQKLFWDMPLPPDLERWLMRLRERK